MKETIIEKVKDLFEDSRIEAFLGLKEENGQIGPYLFTDPKDLEGFSLGDKEWPGDKRYPLSKILIALAQKYPENRFGILVRGCDERALNELFKWNQLNEEHVVMVGFPCPQELAEACECPKPYPESLVVGEKVKGIKSKKVEVILNMGMEGRLKYWTERFSRCIKCYGCRNVCPVCFCNECELANDDLIPSGEIPPENPIFHLVRAAHMAGRCIDCGLCEEACPVGIPLRTLYKKVADIVDSEFGYRPGYQKDQKSPFNILGERPED
nr:4Fe-4S ferredoxin [Desulfobacterales bacterium]